MKKLLLAVIMLLTLLPAVQAEGEEVPAGTTPDSIFYFIDRAIESLDLALTFNEEDKVAKLIAYAEERLAEAEEMNEEQKEEFIEELILEYLADLEEASDELMNLEEGAAEEQEAELDEALAKSDEIAEDLVTSLFEKLEAKKGEAYIKFTVLKESLGENEAEIMALAEEHDLGLGELAKIASGAKLLEQDFLETLNAVIELGSIEEYFAQFEINISDLVSKGIEMKQERLQEKLAEAIEAGDTKKAAQAEFQIKHSVAIKEFKEAKEEIKEKREAVLTEYGVEDMDELPEEVKIQLQEELKEDQKVALEAKKVVIEEKKAAIKEAIEEIKEAKEEEKVNGKSDEVDKGYEKLKEKVNNGKKDK